MEFHGFFMKRWALPLFKIALQECERYLWKKAEENSVICVCNGCITGRVWAVWRGTKFHLEKFVKGDVCSVKNVEMHAPVCTG